MLFGAADALLLAGVVLILYAALTPLRRWLTRRIARRLAPRRPTGGRVVVLERRGDGSFGRGNRHG